MEFLPLIIGLSSPSEVYLGAWDFLSKERKLIDLEINLWWSDCEVKVRFWFVWVCYFCIEVWLKWCLRWAWAAYMLQLLPIIRPWNRWIRSLRQHIYWLCWFHAFFENFLWFFTLFVWWLFCVLIHHLLENQCFSRRFHRRVYLE